MCSRTDRVAPTPDGRTGQNVPVLVLVVVAAAAVVLPALSAAVLVVQARVARAAARHEGAIWGGVAQFDTAHLHLSDAGARPALRRRSERAGGILLVGTDGVRWRPVRVLAAREAKPWSMSREQLTGWSISRAPLAVVGHVLELRAADGLVVRLDVVDATGAGRALGRLLPRTR
jgi:hypothetical protein